MAEEGVQGARLEGPEAPGFPVIQFRVTGAQRAQVGEDTGGLQHFRVWG